MTRMNAEASIPAASAARSSAALTAAPMTALTTTIITALSAALITALTATLITALTATLCTTSLAGPNAGGTLVLHTSPGLEYTAATDYCELSDLTDCHSVVASASGTQAVVFWVIAAFHADTDPRLAGATFGIAYDASAFTLLAYGDCADFSLSDVGWPAPHTGAAVTWDPARTSHLTTLYWFAGYRSDASPQTEFRLVPHPVGGSYFADDAVPSNLDAVAALGVLGFDQPGVVQCPGPPPPTGACCSAGGGCGVFTAEQCFNGSGTYLGDDIPCEPDPCPLPGACCFPSGDCNLYQFPDQCEFFGGVHLGEGVACEPNPCTDQPGACCIGESCSLLSALDCLDAGGVSSGSGTLCEPDPCAPTPVERTSWGNLKSRYRWRLRGDARP